MKIAIKYQLRKLIKQFKRENWSKKLNNSSENSINKCNWKLIKTKKIEKSEKNEWNNGFQTSTSFSSRILSSTNDAKDSR